MMKYYLIYNPGGETMGKAFEGEEDTYDTWEELEEAIARDKYFEPEEHIVIHGELIPLTKTK